MGLMHQIKVAQAAASSILQGGRGISGNPYVKQPEQPIEIYEYEGSPFSRRVREVLTELNLDAVIYPCPRGGKRFRPQVKPMAGKTQFPFMVDPNTGVKMLESQDIINYLFAHYSSTGKTPKRWQNLPKVPVQSTLVSLASGLRGIKSRQRKPLPADFQKLELWSFDGSPYSRLVREALCELEVPYILHNVAKERWQDMGPAVLRLKPGKYVPLANGKREKMLPLMQGKMQVPYLVDANTGRKLFESDDIVAYLNQTYGK